MCAINKDQFLILRIYNEPSECRVCNPLDEQERLMSCLVEYNRSVYPHNWNTDG